MANSEDWNGANDDSANGRGMSSRSSRQRRLPPSSPSASLSQESMSGQRRRRQQDDALSWHSANLSVAELSRMEETVLSKASHHQEEEERQRKRLERKARRDSGIKAKRIVKPPTEIQIERRRVYSRFKYTKKTDLMDERDVGGSMEIHARRILGRKAERKRLESVARAREGSQTTINKNAMDVESIDARSRRKEKNRGVKSSEDDEVNWNFLDMGYTTMPVGDAAKLPYYIHGKSKRGRHPVPEIDATRSESIHTIDVCRSEKRRKMDDDAVASGGIGGRKRRSPRSTKRVASRHPMPAAEPCNDVFPRSFPLHFHQSKKRMDLHGMIDTITSGSERMVFAHGRNATRLWIRLVASGVMARDFDVLPRANKTDVVDQTRANYDDDSASNVSASSFSSKSSVHSYHQMSYGNTSVITMENVDDDKSTASSVNNARKNPLFLLMSMVHSLPKFTHRHRFLIQIARELGANRRLWDDELKCLVECVNDKSDGKDGENLIPRDRRVIMSFLGVDGKATSPPGWASDPLMPTHPTVLKQRVHVLRSLLVRNLRRSMQKQQNFDTISPTEDLVESISSSNGRTTDVPIIEHAESEWAISSVKIEGGEVDMQHRAPTTTFNSEFADDRRRETRRNVSGTHDSAKGFTHEATNSEGFKELPPAKEEEEGEPPIAGDESRALMVSLIDEIQRPDRGSVDTFSKVTHESQIEVSHIDVALASFIDHLTSSMARLRQKQLLDSSDFLHRRSLRLLKEEVGFWHETIDSYLNLATSLTEIPDVNFFKSSGVFPESAARAKAIIATQSYLANGGGVGCGRKRWKSKLSSWEAKEKNNSSDDSDASDLDNNDHTSANLERGELHCIKLAAMEIAKRGKERDKKSTAFTAIHITTGIAMIVEVLTPRAAELMSRQPCPDIPDNRTPFDLISNMLALVEEDGSLISAPPFAWEARDKIIDDTLVKAMLKAVMMFRNCIVNEPGNVDHWSWYVATLLGMLCIAFGASGNDHPGRQQLENFPRILSYAAVAVKDFVSFALSHDCAMFHLAVSSMLEWKKPILLLHRPRQKYRLGLEVNYLHAYHVSEFVR
ncbi:hypothetical protein ACHAXA_009969 [Cyclostephanos tholiformis]|uniref:Uncharacterized protein n=1 Tax=Cyclostephanos tholiformis TaxID=382380 RepID=A0ABD3RCV9_9STRA